MQTFTDILLSKFDSAVRKLNPVNALIDKVVSRVAPTVEAKACGGTLCYYLYCNPGDGCAPGFALLAGVYSSQGGMGCATGATYTCYACIPSQYCPI